MRGAAGGRLTGGMEACPPGALCRIVLAPRSFWGHFCPGPGLLDGSGVSGQSTAVLQGDREEKHWALSPSIHPSIWDLQKLCKAASHQWPGHGHSVMTRPLEAGRQR